MVNQEPEYVKSSEEPNQLVNEDVIENKMNILPHVINLEEFLEYSNPSKQEIVKCYKKKKLQLWAQMSKFATISNFKNLLKKSKDLFLYKMKNLMGTTGKGRKMSMVITAKNFPSSRTVPGT